MASLRHVYSYNMTLIPALSRLSVEINVGQGDEGFSVGEHGLVSSNPEWVGWLGKLPPP